MAVQDCDQPEWLVAYAWQVHELTRTREAQEKFAEMLRQWAVEQWELQKRIRRKYSSSEVVPIGQNTAEKHDYTPTPEERPDLWGPRPFCFGSPLSLPDRYAVAALTHDLCVTPIRERVGEYVPVLNPWGVDLHGPSTGRRPGRFWRRFRRGKAEFLAALGMTMAHIVEKHEPLIRDCIEAVRADLGGPAAGQAAGGTAAEEPTPDNRAPDERGRPVLQVERWSDLAIGIGEDGSYLAVTPCPECGEVFPKEKAAELDLSGKRWKSLLDLLAQSEDGRQARKTDLMVSFGYRKSHDRPEGSLRDLTDNKYLMKTLKTARGRLTTGIADLARKLRQQVAGPTDPKGKCALSVASAETVEAGFTVRYLLRGTDEKLRFGKPPG